MLYEELTQLSPLLQTDTSQERVQMSRNLSEAMAAAEPMPIPRLSPYRLPTPLMSSPPCSRRFRFGPFQSSDLRQLGEVQRLHAPASTSVGIPLPYSMEFGAGWIMNRREALRGGHQSGPASGPAARRHPQGDGLLARRAHSHRSRLETAIWRMARPFAAPDTNPAEIEPRARWMHRVRLPVAQGLAAA